MTFGPYSCRTLSLISDINEATSSKSVLSIFQGAVADLGAEHFGILFLPRPHETVEEVCLAWSIPAAWRELYSRENFLHADPGVRHARRTVMPFDWATAPYDPESETRRNEIIERARDICVHKALMIPVPSPHGMIGLIGVMGPHFDARLKHKPVLHSLALNVFYRLDQLHGNRKQGKVPCLTEREREVLNWAAEGKTAWEIGCILNISQRTVEGYFYQACKKLGASNRTQAIAILGSVQVSATR